MSQPDGGPAFPSYPTGIHDKMVAGMSLRDWFAGMALSGLARNEPDDRNEPYDSDEKDLVIKDAYAYADAMLKQREQL